LDETPDAHGVEAVNLDGRSASDQQIVVAARALEGEGRGPLGSTPFGQNRRPAIRANYFLLGHRRFSSRKSVERLVINRLVAGGWVEFRPSGLRAGKAVKFVDDSAFPARWWRCE